MLEVWDDVLAVPMIGSFDEERRTSVMMALPDAITRRRARWVLLDLTGGHHQHPQGRPEALPSGDHPSAPVDADRLTTMLARPAGATRKL